MCSELQGPGVQVQSDGDTVPVCGLGFVASYCSSAEESITLGVIHSTATPAQSCVISELHEALPRERWTFRKPGRRMSLAMLKFQSVTALGSGAALAWAAIPSSWRLLGRAESRVPKLLSLTVTVWGMAGRGARETSQGSHEGRSWQRLLHRGCQNQSSRRRLTCLC